MKNTMLDLNNHLFAQLERLNDEDLAGEELKQEITRSQAITGVAREIIANGNLVLKARIAHDDKINPNTQFPGMLGIEK
jgi:hypothetical protein